MRGSVASAAAEDSEVNQILSQRREGQLDKTRGGEGVEVPCHVECANVWQGGKSRKREAANPGGICGDSYEPFCNVSHQDLTEARR